MRSPIGGGTSVFRMACYRMSPVAHVGTGPLDFPKITIAIGDRASRGGSDSTAQDLRRAGSGGHAAEHAPSRVLPAVIAKDPEAVERVLQ
jgi:hypothetical protein